MTAIWDDDGAAYWAIRLEEGTLSSEEQGELDRWLATDDRRQGTLLRAEAALAYLDRGRALASAPPRLGRKRKPPSFNRRALLTTGVAALAAASFGGVMLLNPVNNIETHLGEIRRVPLADGSVAALNTATSLNVEFETARRIVEIEDGEAWFQVAPDQERPFIVAAGDVRVKALGTAFSVRRRDGGADVLVTEGVVEVWVADHEATRTKMTAGTKGFVSDAVPRVQMVKDAQEVERALAWRRGELALDGESLAAAVSELNRYNSRRIVIADPELATETLVGYFRTSDPEGFARAIAGMFGAKMEVQGRTIRLTRPKS